MIGESLFKLLGTKKIFLDSVIVKSKDGYYYLFFEIVTLYTI